MCCSFEVLFSLLTVISFIWYQVWLIEINVDPALHTNCQTLREVVPGVVKETLSFHLSCLSSALKQLFILRSNSEKTMIVT